MMFPPEVVTAILQHVPQRQRLDQCALVCSTWRAAAVEASTSIDTRAADVTQLKSLSMWLESYGSRLLNLSIAGPEQQNAEGKGSKLSNLSIAGRHRRQGEQTPFSVSFSQLQQLQALQLSRLTIAGSTNDSSLYSGTLANLTGLTSLQLHRTVFDNRDLPEFSTITSLRRLLLSNMIVRAPTVLSMTFPTQITCLILDSMHLRVDLKSLGLLSQLEHLQLAVLDFNQSALSDLPLSLTHLEMYDPDDHLSTARLGELTALVHLDVQGEGCIEPQLLSGLVQLRHISFYGLGFHHNQGNGAGVERLLAILPGLSQLECLDLSECQVVAVESVQQYSALVSSSALTCLDLHECPLQDNAVLHMFTAGRQCPALQVLRLGSCAEVPEVPHSICHGALEALVHACPALQELQLLPTAMDPSCWAQLSALQRLTGLSNLMIGGSVVHDDSIALLTSLELPSLRKLTIRPQYRDQDTCTARGLLSLRKMTQLTRLELWHRSLCCGSWSSKPACVLFSKENGLTCLEELLESKLKLNLES